jgi:hypothetical protein
MSVKEVTADPKYAPNFRLAIGSPSIPALKYPNIVVIVPAMIPITMLIEKRSRNVTSTM